MNMALYTLCWLMFLFCYQVDGRLHTAKRPNILVILNDDQDSSLGGLEPMEITRRLVAEQGATFTNAFVSTAVCCPSRASILTGKYIHNHRVLNNSVAGNCSSVHWRQTAEKRTMAAHLHQRGYTTFYGGKYLNQYGKSSTEGGVAYVPPGYDRWVALVGNSRYYNYTLSIDGRPELHADDYERDYLTDLLGREALAFIDNATSGSAPFFAMIAPPACHSPFTPAPQFAGRFADRRAPRLPNFNVHAAGDKHWLARQRPDGPLSDEIVARVDHIFRQRWRTLLSVDHLIGQLVKLLRRRGVLDNTFVMVTSDHGYHMGQFALPVDKRLPYETDIRVPLLVRGPGVAPGLRLDHLVVSIDVAPTVLDMAGIDVPSDMDGVSLLPLLRSQTSHPVAESQLAADDDRRPAQPLAWRTSFLIEYHGEADLGDVDPQCQQDADTTLCLADFDCKCQDSRNNTYSCFRLLRPSCGWQPPVASRQLDSSLFCQFSDAEDFVEYYDLQRDPYQLVNEARQSAGIRQGADLGRLLDQHRRCGGSDCFQPFVDQ